MNKALEVAKMIVWGTAAFICVMIVLSVIAQFIVGS